MKFGKINFIYIVIIVSLFPFSIGIESNTLYDDCSIYGICQSEITNSGTTVNYSTVNVNNSLYWQGHTGTDGSWLTGTGNNSFNETYTNTKYLKLNQATPQTITGGYPRFNSGIGIPANNYIFRVVELPGAGFYFDGTNTRVTLKDAVGSNVWGVNIGGEEFATNLDLSDWLVVGDVASRRGIVDFQGSTIAGAYATGTVTFSDQPLDGDTITLFTPDDTPFIFEFDTDTDFSNIPVTIGVDVDATGANLQDAINSQAIWTAYYENNVTEITAPEIGTPWNKDIVYSASNVVITGMSGGLDEIKSVSWYLDDASGDMVSVGGLKAGNNIEPTTTDLWDIGSSLNRWLKGWFVDMDISNDINIGNNAYVGSSLDVTSDLEVGNNLNIGGDINLTGNLDVEGNMSIKRPYGMFSSTQDQTLTSANTAYPVTFNWTEDTWQIIKEGDINFTFIQQGDYSVEISAIAQTAVANKNIHIFPQIWNGTVWNNIPRSNTETALRTTGSDYVISVPFILDILSTEKFRLMWGANDNGVILNYKTNTSWSPETPSIIMTISKISEITE